MPQRKPEVTRRAAAGIPYELTRKKVHSPAFWAEVEKLLPDWKERRALLK